MMQVVHHNVLMGYMQIYAIIKMRRKMEFMPILKI